MTDVMKMRWLSAGSTIVADAGGNHTPYIGSMGTPELAEHVCTVHNQALEGGQATHVISHAANLTGVVIGDNCHQDNHFTR